MGFDNECILNIQSLAGEYFCPVCRLLVYPNEAIQSQCTHLYCKPCLSYVVSTTRACPYDGYLVTEADSKPLVESNKALAETIGKILVHCLYHRSGCTWQGPLSECTAHCSGCAFGNSPVVCNRCGVQIVHRQVQEHAQNCPGVQPQAQQAEGVQEAVGPGATVSSAITQSGAATSTATVSQTAVVDPNQQVNLTTQSQAVAQTAAPTSEQWYQQQQQQQYQQYYQQYPGSYDPYQQQYQQYNPYQSQPVQQFSQQHIQAAAPQALGQPPQQMYVQPHPQAQSHVQPPLQPQAQSQIPSQIVGQPQPHPHVQAPVLAQNPNLAAVTPQQPHPTVPQHSQIQAQPHPPPYGQPQPFPQAQPHPQHHPQLPQHQQPHPHIQHAPPQIQSLPSSQIHPQHSIPQTQQLPHQPQPQLPSQPNQPQSHIAQHQGPPHPSVHVATQPHPHHQIPMGAPQQHPMHTPYQNGPPQQAQHPVQMQGQYPHQPPQMRPPHAPMPNQQQATTLASQGQLPNIPPAQQLPVHPNAQQPGQPLHQRPVQPIQQPVSQQYVQQQQPFPVPHQGHFGQQLPPPPQSQLRPQGPPHSLQQTSQAYPQSQQNVVLSHGMQSHQIQNHAGRPMMPNSGVPSQPFPQAPGAPAGIQARPMQIGANQIYPQPGYAQQPLIPQSGLTTKPTVVQGDAETPSQGIVKKDANGVVATSGIGFDSADVKSGIDMKTTDDEQKKIIGAVDKNKLAEPDNGSGEPVIKRTVKEETTDKKGDEIVGLDQSDVPKNPASQQGELLDEQSVKLQKDAVDMTGGEKGSLEVVPVSTPIPGSSVQNIIPEGTIPEQVKGRNQLPQMPYGPSHQQRPGAPSVLQSMPPGLPLHAQLPGHPFNSQGILGPGSAATFGRGPSQVGPPNRNFEPPQQGPYNQGHMPPPGVGGPPLIPPPPGSFDSHGGMMTRGGLHGPEGEMFSNQRPGFFDGRQPNPHLPGALERGPFGQSSGIPPNAKLNGASGLDSSATLGFPDERFKPLPNERLNPFPMDPSRHMIGRGEFEEDLKQFPRPSNLEAEKFGSYTRLGERGSHGFGIDAPPRHLDKAPHGYNYDSGLKFDANPDIAPSRFLPPHHPGAILPPNDGGGRPRPGGLHEDFPVPGFGRHHADGLNPRSPVREYSGIPSRGFGIHSGPDDFDGKRPFGEGSKSSILPSDPVGGSFHESRFPTLPSHLRRGEFDGPGNVKIGEHVGSGPHNQMRRGDFMGPRHLGEPAGFGTFPVPGRPPMGEFSTRGNFPQGESFVGGNKSGHPRLGEPGFRSSYSLHGYPNEGVFPRGDMEAFDNLRKRKPPNMGWCRICKVDCETVEGLDLHSQTREHQKMAMDMVLSIKQQNAKRLKKLSSNDHSSLEEAKKARNTGFEGRGNKH